MALAWHYTVSSFFFSVCPARLSFRGSAPGRVKFFELSFVFRHRRRRRRRRLRVFGERRLKFGINIQFMGCTDRMTDGIYSRIPRGEGGLYSRSQDNGFG